MKGKLIRSLKVSRLVWSHIDQKFPCMAHTVTRIPRAYCFPKENNMPPTWGKRWAGPDHVGLFK